MSTLYLGAVVSVILGFAGTSKLYMEITGT